MRQSLILAVVLHDWSMLFLMLDLSESPFSTSPTRHSQWRRQGSARVAQR